MSLPLIPESSNPPVVVPPKAAAEAEAHVLTDPMVLRLLGSAEMIQKIPVLAKFDPNRPQPKKTCCRHRKSSGAADIAAIKTALVNITPAQRIELKNFFGIRGKLAIRYRLAGQAKAKVVVF